VLCAGIVAAATYNVWRGEGSPPITAADFLPDERPEKSEEEIEAAAVAFFEKLSASSHQQHQSKLVKTVN
jgi:hypothetical protein